MELHLSLSRDFGNLWMLLQLVSFLLQVAVQQNGWCFLTTPNLIQKYHDSQLHSHGFVSPATLTSSLRGQCRALRLWDGGALFVRSQGWLEQGARPTNKRWLRSFLGPTKTSQRPVIAIQIFPSYSIEFDLQTIRWTAKGIHNLTKDNWLVIRYSNLSLG